LLRLLVFLISGKQRPINRYLLAYILAWCYTKTGNSCNIWKQRSVFGFSLSTCAVRPLPADDGRESWEA